jgi:hypothetical protein
LRKQEKQVNARGVVEKFQSFTRQGACFSYKKTRVHIVHSSFLFNKLEKCGFVKQNKSVGLILRPFSCDLRRFIIKDDKILVPNKITA